MEEEQEVWVGRWRGVAGGGAGGRGQGFLPCLKGNSSSDEPERQTESSSARLHHRQLHQLHLHHPLPVMAAASKSSQTAKNVVLALLALWSIASLVVIVVWATSPDLKSSAQCRAELHDTTVKLEGARVVWSKDKVALEEQVEAGREEQDRLKAHILMLVGHLNTTNATLHECRQENVVLNGNISALQLNVEQLRQTEANLTAQLNMQEDRIEALQQNLTQTVLETETCRSLKNAADSQKMAAQSQNRACESKQQYLERQLHKCKVGDSEAPPLKQDPPPSTTHPPSSAPSLSGFPSLALLVIGALHLMT